MSCINSFSRFSTDLPPVSIDGGLDRAAIEEHSHRVEPLSRAHNSLSGSPRDVPSD